MKVNYIREMNAWMDFVLDEEPSANAQLLWHTLMALFNRRGEGDEWPEEIAISNQKLLLFLPFGETALKEARAELCALGRIRHIAGRRGERPRYALVPLSAAEGTTSSVRLTPDSFPKGEADQDADAPASAPVSVDKSDFSTSGRDDVADSVADRVATATQSRPHTPNVNAYAHIRDDDDERDARPRLVILSEPVSEEQDENLLREAFAERLPELPVTKAALHDLLMIARDLGQTPGVVCDAVAVAARRCARSPVDYILTLLDDWSREGVRTQQDLGELLVMRDALSGRIAVGGVTRQDLDEARERRRAR